MLTRVHAFLAARGIRVYAVGGFVREALRGRTTRDLDLAVQGDATALAQQLAERSGGTFVLLDKERGVARVAIKEAEGEWNLDLSPLRGGDILADLAQRDFTVDAMAVELAAVQGEPGAWPLIDPHGSLADLRAQVIRAVNTEVFRLDPVRLLRAVRLATQLKFSIDFQTLELLRRDVRLIATVSPERCREELLKIMAHPGVGAHLRLMDEVGLLCTLIPELADGKGVAQPPEHFWDVFNHGIECAAALERILEPSHRQQDPALRLIPWAPWLDEHFAQEASDGHSRATLAKLASLLHDIAKPETKTVTPSGRLRFLGHHEEGARRAEAIARRLRLSNRGVELIATMVHYHLRPSQLAQHGELPTPRAIYRYFREVNEAAVDTLYLCLADYLAARGPRLELDDWQRQCSLIEYTLRRGTGELSIPSTPKLIDGHDLMTLFNLKPGPRFRELLEAVREAQATGEVNTREEALKLLEGLVQNAGPKGDKG
ncbi:MAG: HD domain-containing protein [Chloroflexi bacterium]|nr:HD domain-containing protein [Chloroflexota bacterium]